MFLLKTALWFYDTDSQEEGKKSGKVNIKQCDKGKEFIASYKKATVNGVEKGSRRMFRVSGRFASWSKWQKPLQTQSMDLIIVATANLFKCMNLNRSFVISF